ncbi:MAG: gamma-glutamylcyclotransferase [Chloracidobacterium sp.]|nr:gamma-glutamylcyclotransferase [Chloracidobacterium sp.]
MEYLFSYGTLQKSETQLELFGRLLNGWSDTLEGYKTAEIAIDDAVFLTREGSRQLTAVASSGDKIYGMIFEISAEELERVDRYEPGNYERIKVTLRSGKQAWIYLKR